MKYVNYRKLRNTHIPSWMTGRSYAACKKIYSSNFQKFTFDDHGLTWSIFGKFSQLNKKLKVVVMDY